MYNYDMYQYTGVQKFSLKLKVPYSLICEIFYYMYNSENNGQCKFSLLTKFEEIVCMREVAETNKWFLWNGDKLRAPINLYQLLSLTDFHKFPDFSPVFAKFPDFPCEWRTMKLS